MGQDAKKKLNELYQLALKDAEKTAQATRIMEMKLSTGDKLNLMGMMSHNYKNDVHAHWYRRCSIRLDVTSGVCAVMVPLLIPIAQQYSGAIMKVSGVDVDTGKVIALIAIFISIMGSIVSAYKNAAKVSEYAALYDKEVCLIEDEFVLFLAQAGKYRDIANQNGDDADLQTYKLFVEARKDIRESTSRTQLFSSVGAKDSQATKRAPDEENG